ncbi:hypothetical protein RHCRD62_50377 [Rhodococcus sp. RD6.2]|nr:hypothetical protein RHCRD62_50377 [Rhodococcus sp. RD6.2]
MNEEALEGSIPTVSRQPRQHDRRNRRSGVAGRANRYDTHPVSPVSAAGETSGVLIDYRRIACAHHPDGLDHHLSGDPRPLRFRLLRPRAHSARADTA